MNDATKKRIMLWLFIATLCVVFFTAGRLSRQEEAGPIVSDRPLDGRFYPPTGMDCFDDAVNQITVCVMPYEQ